MYLTTGASSTSVSSSIGVGAGAPSSRPTSMSSRFAMSFSVAPLASTILCDRLAELVVLDDDRLGHEVGLEPDLLQRLQVGRVGDRDEQLVAALVQRQHAPRLRDLEIDVFLVDLVEVEAREVEQRHAERARGEHRELLRGHALAEQHLLDERDAGRLRLRLQGFGLVLGHEPAAGRARARDR